MSVRPTGGCLAAEDALDADASTLQIANYFRGRLLRGRGVEGLARS
jgi:hypothetical protein